MGDGHVKLPPKQSAGIYVHIPFCAKKCDYCDFLSAPAAAEVQARYMKALRTEIRLTGAETSKAIDTIFFGGGTPSLLPAEEISQTLAEIRSCFCVSGDAEITVECNPGTLTEEKCRIYREAGVNRLSIGLQSADDRLLKEIGRIHSWKQFLESCAMARKAGFTNINIDLMSGLPGQSVADHTDTLKKVMDLRPEHISAYSLILEEGTPLYERVRDAGEGTDAFPGLRPEGEPEGSEHPDADRRRDGRLPSEEDEMEMYVRTGEILRGGGYHRYEISNYSLPGMECRHNLRYWNLDDYYGFGIGAASFVNGCRYRNTEDRDLYIKTCEKANIIVCESVCADAGGNACRGADQGVTGDAQTWLKALRPEIAEESVRELMEEFMFLGLRKTAGISKSEFRGRFGKEFEAVYGNVSKRLLRLGLLKETEDTVCLTNRGIDVSNEVLAEFLLD